MIFSFNKDRRWVVPFITVVMTFLFSFLMLTQMTHAQVSGISITPAVIEETLDPGAEKQFTLTVQNLDTAESTFYLFTRNISGVREGGIPVFATNDSERTGYELADWIALSVSEITLAPGDSTTVDFTMRVPGEASPGSHFGGVFISMEPPQIEGSGAAVGYQVANIITIRVAGDAVVQGGIRQFSTSRFMYSAPVVDFEVRIENSGNVLIRPAGPLEVYNMLGNKVGTMMFNEEQSAVFPGDTRSFTNLRWDGGTTGFGRYEAILSPVYGEQGSKQTMSSTLTFWVLPTHIIFPALGVLAVLLLVVFVIARLYVKRSLAQLTVGRRMVRKRQKSNSSTVLLLVVVMLTVTVLFLIAMLALFA